MSFLNEFRSDMKDMSISRPGGETIVDNKPSVAAPTTIPFRGIIQRLTSKDIRFLPEGLDAFSSRTIWSETEIKNKDVITDDEDAWRVVGKVFRHEGDFYRAMATSTTGAVV